MTLMVSMGLSPWATAQSSPDCGYTSPCVRVALEDPQHDLQFENDAGHFLYCADGQTLTITALAVFNSPNLCSDCDHSPTPREWEWSWQGPSGSTTVSPTQVEVVNGYTQRAEIPLTGASAGDTITVKCKVKNVTGGECEEDQRGRMGEHTAANHLGAEATCTIKLWRMDLTVTGGDAEQDVAISQSYMTTFSKSVTTTASLVGASAATPLWNWESFVNEPQVHASKSGGTDWTGEMVAPTTISVTAYVINGCDSTVTTSDVESVGINPSKRRPNWTTEVQLAATDSHWLSGDPNAFPQIDWSLQSDGTLPRFGRLANAQPPFDKHYTAAVVPIYNDWAEYPYHHSSFPSMAAETSTGPNERLYYNSDPTMFEIRRQVLSNHWIHPSAGHPIVPALDNDGYFYTNWLEVVEVAFGPNCKCPDPDVHGGTGTGAWYRANRYHEGRGSPDSPNKRLLGHHSRLEDGFSAEERSWVDPIYRCDLVYADTIDGLRAADETHRKEASDVLILKIGALHTYHAAPPEKHNFHGDIWVFGPAPKGWNAVSRMF